MKKISPNIIRQRKKRHLSSTVYIFDENGMKRKRTIKSTTQKSSSLASTNSSDINNFTIDSIGSFTTPLPLEHDKPLSAESSHFQRKLKVSNSWEEVLDLLVAGNLKNQVLPNKHCFFCNSTNGNIRCKDCSQNIIWCNDCFKNYHIPDFHRPEIWNGIYFEALEDDGKVLHRYDEHECIFHIRELILFDSKGRQHKRKIAFCKCEKEVETLIRFNFWPVSPSNPKVAVSLDLMELIQEFYLECHQSLKGIAQVFKNLSREQNNLTSDLYRSITGETFEMYRAFRNNTRKLLNPPDPNICPACPKNLVNVISLDGNFGLIRRKASGKASRSPHNSAQFFLPQEDVDHFIETYSEKVTTNRISKDCSNFQAANELRSNFKTNKIDETGVFGAACRHEHPRLFLSMKHGERLGYSVFILKKLLEQSPESNLIIMYDIGCLLSSHLRNPKNQQALKTLKLETIIDKIKLAVPVFHGYAHNMACQIKFNPKRIEGTGLTDGETLERLWSYLRPFKFITKEMSAEHRIDMLSDALQHYSQRVKNNLAVALRTKMDRASVVKRNTQSQLQSLLEKENISNEIIEKWVDDTNITSVSSSDIPLWKLEYAKMLHKFYEQQSSNQSVDERLERQLLCYETEHNFTRLQRNDRQLISLLIAEGQRERNNQKEVILKLYGEKMYTFSLIRKYGDGQSITTRLRRKATRLNKKIQKLITDYNSISLPCGPTCDKTLNLESLGTNSANNQTIKRKVIDLYFLYQRAEEEERMVKTEMLSTFSYYIDIFEQLNQQLRTDKTDNFSLGLNSYIMKEMKQILNVLELMDFIFSKYVEINMPQSELKKKGTQLDNTDVELEQLITEHNLDIEEEEEEEEEEEDDDDDHYTQQNI